LKRRREGTRATFGETLVGATDVLIVGLDAASA
jgi:hypothetical protein